MFLEFSAKTLDLAISPRKSRRPLSVASGINGAVRAWEWLYYQVRTGVQDPQRLHRDPVGAIGILFARVSTGLGVAAPTLTFVPTAATQPSDMWNIASDCRIAAKQWPAESQSSDCEELVEAVQENINRGRVRLALEQARSQVGSDEATRDLDGNIISYPSDDELIPPVSQDTVLAQTSCPEMDPTRSKKRDGAPIDAPESKMAKTGEASQMKWRIWLFAAP